MIEVKEVNGSVQAYEGDKLLGTARLYINDDSTVVDNIILNDISYREFLVRAALFKAMQKGKSRIIIYDNGDDIFSQLGFKNTGLFMFEAKLEEVIFPCICK